MRTSPIVVCLCLLAATAVGSGEVLPTAKPEEVGLSSAKLGEIVPAVKRLVAAGRISGAVTVVARRGKIAHFEATGLMDVAKKRPMAVDTIFRIYSMSKPVTAVAALILVDEGKLDLDAPVAKYLPEFKELTVLAEGKRVAPRRAMTVRDLMRHTSGLTYGYFSRTPVDRMYLEVNILNGEGTLADMVTKLAKIPLLYHPGERWHYSVSIDVLGRVIEVVSEKPLDVFMKARIFDPLGMVDTGFHVPKKKHARFAVNYGPAGKGLRIVDHPGSSRFGRPATLFSGGGGLVSTATDYLRFAQMLVNGGVLGRTRILKSETVAAMTSNQLEKKLVPIRFGATPMPGTGFGLGVSVRIASSPLPFPGAVGEYGWAGAASTSFWIVPGEEMVGMVMTQLMPFSVTPQIAVKRFMDGAVIPVPEKAGAGK